MNKQSPQSRKDVWLIPKRSNIYQIIGIVEALAKDGHDGKLWNHAKQEAVATKMRFRNLTTGRNFSGQSVRTLFANGPKFLGFAYTDSDDQDSSRRGGKIRITKAGYKLVDEDLLNGDQVFNNLSSWEKHHSINDSQLLKLQLIKLILNNPVTHNGGQILVYPFLNALRLCRRLDYLDKEELAYIVFSMTSEDQLDLIEQRIRNFRSLTGERRRLEIEAYSRTEAGVLTLVKAPSANYFINFCDWSGIFRKANKKIQEGRSINVIELHDTEYAEEVEVNLSGRIYNFHDNTKLWIEYYGNPDRTEPPRDISITVEASRTGAFFVNVINQEQLVDSMIIEGRKSTMPITVFNGDTYTVKISYLGAKNPMTKDFAVNDDTDDVNIQFEIPDQGYKAIDLGLDTLTGIQSAIREISAGNGYDKAFLDILNLRKELEGKDFMNNRTKGGRLEYLFFRMLSILYDKSAIDYVKWYGKIGSNGIPGPAPGGKNGNPDIVFEIDDIAVVIELTTIRGNAGQWAGSEAASVPDHIKHYAEQNSGNRTLGIFSAPSINSRVESNFKSQSHIYGVPIHCMPLEEFSRLLLKPRSELKAFLEAKLG